MAALVGKLASSGIAQKLASSSLGQSIIDKVAPNADALQAKMLQRGGPPGEIKPSGGPPGQPGPKLPGVGSGIDTLPITSKIEKGIGKVVELKDKFDGKLDSYYWTLRIVLVLVVVTVISIIIYKYKLPLICYGCESPEGFSKYIFRCVNDTSQDSDLCKISNAIDQGTEGISKEFDKITIISRSVFKQLSQDIPDTIKNALSNIINEISGLISSLTVDITNLPENFIKFLNNAYSSMPEIYIKTRDELYTVVLKPIMDFLSEGIIKGISAIITQLMSFKQIVSDAISNTISKVTGVFVDLKNEIIKPLENLPKSLEAFINQIIHFLNDFAKGGAAITRKSIGTIVDGINEAIKKIIGFLNDFAKGGAKITRDSIGTVVNGISTAVNDTISGINTVVKGATGATRTAVHGAIDGIELGVNTTVSGTVTGIETSVNTIVKGINDTVKGATGATRTAVHGVVGGIETAVNDTVGGINTATSGISSGLTTAVNPIVGVVNDVVGGVNKVIDVKVPALKLPKIEFPALNFGTLGSTSKVTVIEETQLVPEWTPFSSVTKAKTVNFGGITIPSINKVTITKPTIDDPKAISDISIPNKPTNKDSKGNLKYISITKPDINDPTAISSVTIPKPTIDDPKVIPDVTIPTPTIKDPEIIPDVSLDKVSEDINKGLSDAYTNATSGIRKVYNDAMDPINTAITTLVGLATALSASITILVEKYLNTKFLTDSLNKIQEKIYIPVSEIIGIIKKEVFDPIYNIILQNIDKIIGVANNIISKLKEIVLLIVEKTNTLFNTLSDTLYAAGTFIIKNIFYVFFYTFTNFVDKIIPLSVPKTVKVNFVLVTIVYILFLHYTSQVRAFVKEFLAQYYILFLLLGSFLALYFLFPKKEEITKMTSDAQQVVNTTVLPAVQVVLPAVQVVIPANMDKKETYQNIEHYIEPYSNEHRNQFSKVTF